MLWSAVLRRLSPRLLDALPVCILPLLFATIAKRTALSKPLLSQAGWPFLGLLAALHAAAYAAGYLLPRAAGLPEAACRGLSIQAGARNPALGLLLASQMFPDQLLVAAPCAAAIFVQNVMGAWLALYWRNRPAQ